MKLNNHPIGRGSLRTEAEEARKKVKKEKERSAVGQLPVTVHQVSHASGAEGRDRRGKHQSQRGSSVMHERQPLVG